MEAIIIGFLVALGIVAPAIIAGEERDEFYIYYEHLKELESHEPK